MSSLSHRFNKLQRIALSLMGVMVLLTFVGANLQAFLWQSSDWLVSTVLPAVVIDLTNKERLDNATVPLQRNSVLDAAAKLKAEHMAKNEYFSHFSPKGVSPWYWFKKSGYTFAHAGENLAIHFTDSDEVVKAWMKSPTHRENIVSGLYTEIGVGTAKGKYQGYDTVYVVQLFGTPGVIPVVPELPTAPMERLDSVVQVSVSTTTSVLAMEEITLSVKDLTSPEVLPEVEGVMLVADNELIVERVENEVVVSSGKTATSVTDNDTYPARNDGISTEPEVVVLETNTIATSSGLVMANTRLVNELQSGKIWVGVVTKPNMILQITYLILGMLVLVLLSISIVLEARRVHYVQVAYGFLLILSMSGLWHVHSWLTSGAVII